MPALCWNGRLSLDPQLGVAGGRIQLPVEAPLGQQADHQLGCGAHQRAGAEVTADHDATAVGDGDVQVGTIGREGAGEAEDLQLAADHRGFGGPRQAQLGQRQAANGTDHTAGLLLLLAHPGFQRPAQVIARLKAQRHHLHGIGASSRAWIITSAST